MWYPGVPGRPRTTCDLNRVPETRKLQVKGLRVSCVSFSAALRLDHSEPESGGYVICVLICRG